MDTMMLITRYEYKLAAPEQPFCGLESKLRFLRCRSLCDFIQKTKQTEMNWQEVTFTSFPGSCLIMFIQKLASYLYWSLFKNLKANNKII